MKITRSMGLMGALALLLAALHLPIVAEFNLSSVCTICFARWPAGTSLAGKPLVDETRGRLFPMGGYPPLCATPAEIESTNLTQTITIIEKDGSRQLLLHQEGKMD